MHLLPETVHSLTSSLGKLEESELSEQVLKGDFYFYMHFFIMPGRMILFYMDIAAFYSM